MRAEDDFDAGEFADRLEAMSDDELFAIMQELEDKSEDISPTKRNSSDIFAKIAMVETVIEGRFPGQVLAPYKEWQQRRTGL